MSIGDCKGICVSAHLNAMKAWKYSSVGLGESAKSLEITKAKKAVRSILETVFWHVPQYKTE